MPRIRERGVRPLAVLWLSGVACTEYALVFGNGEDRVWKDRGQGGIAGAVLHGRRSVGGPLCDGKYLAAVPC